MVKEMTCIICPRGCSLRVDLENNLVEGNFCPKGKIYALNEIKNPLRIITTSIEVTNREYTYVSVKTSTPVPKEKIFEIMDEINKIKVKAPVHIGDIVLKNVCSLNIDILITKNIN